MIKLLLLPLAACTIATSQPNEVTMRKLLAGAVGITESPNMFGQSSKIDQGSLFPNGRVKGKPSNWPTTKENMIPKEKGQLDADAKECSCIGCHETFGVFTRRHHCRKCGYVVCDKHSQKKMVFEDGDINGDKVCDDCFNHVSDGRILSPTHTVFTPYPTCIVEAAPQQLESAHSWIEDVDSRPLIPEPTQQSGFGAGYTALPLRSGSASAETLDMGAADAAPAPGHYGWPPKQQDAEAVTTSHSSPDLALTEPQESSYSMMRSAQVNATQQLSSHEEQSTETTVTDEGSGPESRSDTGASMGEVSSPPMNGQNIDELRHLEEMAEDGCSNEINETKVESVDAECSPVASLVEKKGSEDQSKEESDEKDATDEDESSAKSMKLNGSIIVGCLIIGLWQME